MEKKPIPKSLRKMTLEEYTKYIQYEMLMTTEEAARYLRTSKGTLEVWRSTKSHNLPYIKMGGLIRYRFYDLVNFLEKYLKETESNVEEASRRRAKEKEGK